MRIAIDARELCGRPTGVGRYLHGLLAEWARGPGASRHDFTLFAPTGLATPSTAPPFPLHLLSGGNGTRWEQFSLAAAINQTQPDVFFAPAYSAPLRIAAPVVLTVHDVSFASHPEWFGWRERLRRTWLARRSARKAKMVLTDTEQMRDEIMRQLKIPVDRTRVIAPGVTIPGLAGAPTPAPLAPRRDVEARRPVILFVGSIFNRRHVPDLIRAFQRIAARRPDVMLDIVGENRTHPHRNLQRIVDQLNLSGRVRLRSYEPDEVLHQLYKEARAFAFLSEYEGFGLPPLEALLAGIPVVVGDTPTAREVLGDAAIYVPPSDVRVVADRLESLLFDDEMRRRVLERAPAVLARYSWARAARETLEVLESVSVKPPGPKSRVTVRM